MTTPTTDNNATKGILGLWNGIADKLGTLINHSSMALVNRIAIAAIFFLSARTKVDGFMTVNDTAFYLFKEEFKVPLLPYEFAAYLTTYAEHLLPILLVFGLFTRISALGILVMTAVIQFFVYPDAWSTHLAWAGLLLYLIARGGGKLSADQALGIK